MRQYLPALFLCIGMAICGLSACTSDEDATGLSGYEPFVVDSLYSVMLPGNLTETRTMHDFAELQFQDTDIHFYVLGITSPKSRLGDIRRRTLKLSAFLRFLEDDVEAFADSLVPCGESQWQTLADKTSFSVRDYIAWSSFFGDQHELFYRVVAIETPENFHGMIIWAPQKDHMKYWKWIEGIPRSFKPLKDAPK